MYKSDKFIKKFIFDKENNKLAHIVISIIYLLLGLYLATHHEAWRDEAQAFIIAKNLSIKEIFEILCLEGHPCLWFIFLLPFAKLGFSFYYLSYISIFIMTLAVYLFLDKAPFSLIVKIGVLFSSMFLYFNPILCRSYSLIALLVILVTIFHSKRKEKPIIYGVLISLLFQSHVMAFGLVIGLTIELVLDYLNDKDNKKLLISTSLILLSFIMMILSISPRSGYDSGVDVSITSVLKNINAMYLKVRMEYFAKTAWGWINRYTYHIPYILLFISVSLIFIFIIINKKFHKNVNTITTATIGCGVFFGISTFIYFSHTQMTSILMMIILFVCWVLYEDNKELGIRFVVILLLAFNCGLSFIVTQVYIKNDIKDYFSTSKITSLTIENILEQDSIILLECNEYEPAIVAYVSSNREDIKFYDIRNNEEYKFYRAGSSKRNEELSLDYIFNSSKQFNKNVYYLSTNKEIKDDRFIEVYSNLGTYNIRYENYALYKIMR